MGITIYQGSPGPTGPAGPSGGSASFIHVQSVPSSSWVINHNLGFNPAITIVDNTGQVLQTDFAHSSLNSVTVTFAGPTSGTAYLS